jgi:hypothetical protein
MIWVRTKTALKKEAIEDLSDIKAIKDRVSRPARALSTDVPQWRKHWLISHQQKMPGYMSAKGLDIRTRR